MIEIKFILCPLDFSEFSIRAYRHALSLSEHYRAKLVAQHVVEIWRHPSVSFAATASLYDEYCQALRGSGREQLQEFVKKHTYNEIQSELVVNEGSAADLILSFAQERKMDLIVMGTHGLRGFDRLMLGSVTDRVMRAASCPVLAVREPPHDIVAAGQERHNPHRLNRILACADFSEDSGLALNYAFSAAAEYDAELTLLHVLEKVPSAAKTEEAIAEATEQLNKLIPPERRNTPKNSKSNY
jgi:nucleotide-binding universal stress UspA family protein